MKGMKLCFGLLLALFTIFGFSLNDCLDVNALRHDVLYLPLSTQTSSFSSTALANDGLSVSYSSNYNQMNDFDISAPHFFESSFVSSSNKCVHINGTSRSRSAWYPSNQSGTIRFLSYYDTYSNSGSYYNALCQQLSPFGSLSGLISSHPEFDESSLVNIPLVDRPFYSSFLPYYYDYDSYYFSDSAVDTQSGVHYSNTLSTAQIYGIPLNKFKRLEIPLGMSNDSVGSITTNRPFRVNGVFDFSGDGSSFEWGPNISSLGWFKLRYNYRFDDYAYYGTSSCVTNFRSVDFNNFYQLEYSCDLVFEHDVYENELYLYLDIGTDGDYVWDSNVDWKFSSTYIVTDNDETPGGSWGVKPTGNHLSNAPGSAQGLIGSDDGDWFSSLTNLFNFSFINPFAPIFGLFLDQNQCASIPIIAGMIHSEESSICPWFNSDVRNIVTPVLGIFSIMLLFGFLVRWLGARSGNLFDDSVSTDNYSFTNKFRRK